jgi:hypothetical protein
VAAWTGQGFPSPRTVALTPGAQGILANSPVACCSSANRICKKTKYYLTIRYPGTFFPSVIYDKSWNCSFRRCLTKAAMQCCGFGMFILDPDLDPSRISDPTTDKGGNICCLLKMLAETLPFSVKIRVEQQKYNNSVFYQTRLPSSWPRS